MFKNYLRIAWRSLVRNKLFSTVNILGLAFGIGSAMLIFLWVNDELQVDQFHGNGDRLYRVMENQRYSDGRIYTFAATPGPMAPFIKEKYPEIEKASRFTWPVNNLFQHGNVAFYEQGRYADPDFIEMFSYDLIAGDVHTALNDKNSVVISEKLAKKYFGDEPALGKLIAFNTDKTLLVSGVFKDIPANSSIRFEYLISFEHFWDENKNWLSPWDNNNIRTYLLLKPGIDAVAFGEKLKHEIKEHAEKTNVELFIQRYSDAYLYGDFENGVQSGGRIEYVRIFFIVAVFILVIACINFMNLATAQATKRAKEVGLRKVIGAIPAQVFKQFMGESFLMVTLSAAVAASGAYLLMPYFNDITGKQMSFDLLDSRILIIFIGVVIITAFIAGSYPSLVMSEFKPVQVLKGQLKSGSRAALLRKGLVVIQFSLSILLIISTTVVFRQMNFMQNRDIGFDRENVFYVWMETDVREKFETFRTELLSKPGIEAVTASSQLPIDIGNSTTSVQWEGKNPEDRILFSNLSVDYDFIETMKMEIVEGRGFQRDFITDTSGYILNQKAAEKMGFTQGTAGQDLTMWGRKGKIVGVVKDFNFGSLHNPIDPLILRVADSDLYCMLVRAKENESAEALRSAEALWKEFAPAYPFRYAFLNHDWEEFYKAEAQRGKVFNTMAILSIFISCLGLFGLSAFSAERRTKELGIRKALGASVPGLMTLMTREFTVLVMIASCIGCPLGWYLMTEWLGHYAYHIEVGYATLVLAAAVCLVIALLTVSYHSLKVASTSPVKSLRYE
jgi:putative ABC transport system permease protein